MHGRIKYMQDFGGKIWTQELSWKAQVYMKTGLKEKERESVNEIPLAQDMYHR